MGSVHPPNKLRRSTLGLQRILTVLPVAVQPLTVELRDDGGGTARGESAALLTQAERRPLGAEAVAGAVGELGGSTVALRGLDLSALDLAAGAWCSLSQT